MKLDTKNFEEKMKKSLSVYEKELGTIRAGRAKGCPCAVFLACDASENTKKRVGNCCTYYEIPLYLSPLTGAELGSAIGRTGITAAVGITDMGLADALKKILPNSDDCLPRKE